jgi:hypothetical protein
VCVKELSGLDKRLYACLAKLLSGKGQVTDFQVLRPGETAKSSGAMSVIGL